MTQALLLSSSRADDTPFLAHALPFIEQVLGTIDRVLFVPYAGVSVNFDDYTDMVRQVLSTKGIAVDGIHQFDDPVAAVNQAQAILIGGGNTFQLLDLLYRNNLIDAIRSATAKGTPYVGWSAGSNVAGYSIRTTNDMPIVQPPSFNALNLIPVQLNPHYTDYKPPGHNGETRQMRIEEFMVVAPQDFVVGIQEGSALLLQDDKLTLLGDKQGFVFQNGEKKSVEAGADLSFLLG